MRYTGIVLLAVVALAGAQVRKIREVRQNDGEGVPLLLGQTVTVTGIVTEAGHFGYYGPAFVEDTTGGVMLNDANVSSGIVIGDSVNVSGIVSQYKGRTQIEDLTVTKVGAGHQPTPRQFELPWVDDIDTAAGYVEFEGLYVTFDSVQIEHTPGQRFAATNYPVSDPHGGNSQIYIDQDAAELMGREIPDGWITLTGLVSQHSSNTPPRFTGYQVMPRVAADLGVAIVFMPLSEAIKDEDANGIPDRLGQSVTVTGVVTVPSGVFDTTYLDIYFQDTTAGVNLFDWSITDPLDVGDSLMVSAEVDWYKGKTELTSPQITVLARGVGEPEPVTLTCAELNHEAHEGELVRLVGAMTLATELAGNQTYQFEDGTGSIDVRIDANTDIPGTRPVVAPDTFTLVAVKSQYADSTAPLTGYQVQPRFRADFSRTSDDLPLVTIRQAQAPGADGVTPRLLDSMVRIRGRVTGPAAAFTIGSGKSLYIEDETQGVNVYGCSYSQADEPYLNVVGAQWEVVAKVTEYNGLTEVAGGSMFVTDTTAVPVVPKLVPYNTPLTERMESDLITVVGDVIEPPVLSGSGYNVILKNGSAGITVRIGSQTGISVGWIRRGMRLRITGVGGQYDYEAPFNTGYQLLPRSDADLADTTAAFPPTEGLVVDSVLPNPFKPWEGQAASIRVNAPNSWRLTVDVLDLEGRTVRTLLSEGAGGFHDLQWDGTDRQLRQLPAGIYLVNVRGVPPGGGVSSVTRPAVIAARMN